MAESRAAEVAVSWFHLMTAPMTACLAVKVVLRQVGSTSGSMAVKMTATGACLMAVNWVHAMVE